MARQWLAEGVQAHEDGAEEWLVEGVQLTEDSSGGGGTPWDPATGQPFMFLNTQDRRPPRVVTY